MSFTPVKAAIRFGTGIDPRHPLPGDAAVLWESLRTEADPALAVTPWETRRETARQRWDIRRALRDTPEDGDLRSALQALNQADRENALVDLRASLARLTTPPVGLHARLTRFWANHFSAMAQGGILRSARASFIDDAIQPHVTGPFRDMLRAVTLHPLMLAYLDQSRSVGPFSMVGRRRGRGLNENLARELLELHTLGPTGSYTQSDVTQLARLLTGLTFDLVDGFRFEPRIAEPGIIEIFGKRYGGRPMFLEHILAFLDDLAVHPDTATHLARKLARHFVSDAPDEQLVAHMAASYLGAGGELMALYRALLEHPAAWTEGHAKTRAPMELMAASLRALAVPPEQATDLSPRVTNRWLLMPLAAMGEPHEEVPSPAGHGDLSAYWVTPQALAARTLWAMGLPIRLAEMPDPRDFVETALGRQASETLRFAAAGAETRAEGIGLILASPEFSRR